MQFILNRLYFILSILVLLHTAGWSDATKPVFPADESITVQPVRVNELEKRVNIDRQCSYPNIHCLRGNVLYMKNEALSENDYNTPGNRMWVISETLVNKDGTKEHKKGLKKLQQFLNGTYQPKIKPIASFHDPDPLDDIARVFDDCTDYACPGLFEIKGLQYPGADEVRAFVTMDGQNTYGAPNVRVYARKADNYIQLDGAPKLTYTEYMPSMLKPCQAIIDKPYSEKREIKVFNCAVKAYQESPELQKKALDKAQELIETFSIE